MMFTLFLLKFLHFFNGQFGREQLPICLEAYPSKINWFDPSLQVDKYRIYLIYEQALLPFLTNVIWCSIKLSRGVFSRNITVPTMGIPSSHITTLRLYSEFLKISITTSMAWVHAISPCTIVTTVLTISIYLGLCTKFKYKSIVDTISR